MSKTQENNHSIFTEKLLLLLSFIDPNGTISEIYLSKISLFNYMFVCGIGVIINMTILTSLVNVGLWLVVSNAIAIIVAFLWNWSFSVGPYGYIFGLGKEKTK